MASSRLPIAQWQLLSHSNLSDPLAIIKYIKNRKEKDKTMYKVKLETFNGTVKTIELPSRGAVAQFISTYPTQIPAGIAMRISCDSLSISGVIRGKASL